MILTDDVSMAWEQTLSVAVTVAFPTVTAVTVPLADTVAAEPEPNQTTLRPGGVVTAPNAFDLPTHRVGHVGLIETCIAVPVQVPASQTSSAVHSSSSSQLAPSLAGSGSKFPSAHLRHWESKSEMSESSGS